MRTFFELLPHRIEQALGWKALRGARARITRQRTASASLSVATPDSKRRLFVDMAVISNHDAGTGIQRVVRAIALALLAEAPTQWDIRFVSARRKRRYFEITWPAADSPPTFGAPVGEEMKAQPGDVFVGLDYSLDSVRRHRRQLASFRRDGGTLWFLVHDLLPLDRPEWFSRNTVIRYGAWMNVMAGLADGFLCNSAQTETELRDTLNRVYGLRRGFRTQVLPMGYSILEAADTARPQAIPPRFNMAAPFALMVGTLEPRKGHADILAAFDLLWQQGRLERLVLVGRMGWKVEALREQIVGHPEYGRRLLWFDNVGDAELLAMYDACTGVIIASLAEGFGLPLIEALGHGRPVLARDLAVFRIHDGKGVHFFAENVSATELAQVGSQWLDDVQQGAITVALPTEDWGTAAKTMLKAVDTPAY